MITAECFCQEFAKQWNEDKNDQANEQAISHAFGNDTTWTTYMLGNKDSFLNRLSKTLGLTMGREWYTLDAVYYNPQPNLFPAGGMYPARLDVLIEHENGYKVEEEMWKLLLWRSPLKVLIFYDFREDLQAGNTNKANWLDDKLTRLFEMGRAVNAQWLEADGTKYLFLVGRRAQAGAIPVWRSWIVQPGGFDQAPVLRENRAPFC